MTASALIVSHHIAAPLQVIPDDLGNEAKALVAAAAALTITDAATFEAGNGVLIKAHALLKAIDKAVDPIEREIRETGKVVRAVRASVCDPLETAKKSLQGKVSAYSAAENQRIAKLRQEAEDKARQEREAAEKERARLQAIADEEHRQRVLAAQEKAKAEAAELAAVLGEPVEAKAGATATAPVVEIAKPAAPAPVIPAAAKSSALVERQVPTLIIDDQALVPAYIGGQELRPIDKAAVRKAINAGVTVPGAHIEMQSQTAMARQA